MAYSFDPHKRTKRGYGTHKIKSTQIEANRKSYLSSVDKTLNNKIEASQTAKVLNDYKVKSELHKVDEVFDPLTNTVKEVYVEDKSLTARQHLRLLPQTLEFEPIKGKQLLKDGSGELVETEEQRLVWKSSTSLLNRKSIDSTMPSIKIQGFRQNKNRKIVETWKPLPTDTEF